MATKRVTSAKKKRPTQLIARVQPSRLRQAIMKRKKPARTTPDAVVTQIFWPDYVDNVKAIAMRGLTDDEMAAFMGISADLLQSWKAYYPTLAKAIDEGRTKADMEVIAALHKNAVGYDYETDEVVRSRRGAEVVQVTKHFPGETAAQKYWLQNRQPDKWNGANAIHVSSPKGAALNINSETRAMVIHSILNLIQPRPDNEE